MKNYIKTESEIGIVNLTKGKLPNLPFVQIKNFVLGKKYDLSLVFVGNKLSRKLNEEYRRRDYAPNVLSFSLSANSGEIFINPPQAKKECSLFEM
jgi:ssRNA-specific RNase YbeY (16S rRNA maturation enzyme)